MKKVHLALALAGMFLISKSSAISLDDIQLWTGSGTNRAALVIEWNSPEVFNGTTVPAPVANKTLVWGYRFNGTATGKQMFNAIVAANPQLYAVETIDSAFGTGLNAIGFNLDGSGLAGLTDGTVTNLANTFTNGILANPNLNADATRPLNAGDLFWSSDFSGPYWQIWNEQSDKGGFTNSPNRGTSPYFDPNTYNHGEWEYASHGLDDLPLTAGSWIGFSVAAAGYDANTNDAAYYAFNYHEQAPPSPDGTYVAYVCNTNDFAVQIISTSNLDASSPYADPSAILNRPTLQFFDPYDGGVTDRVSIIDPCYNVTPGGSNVITVIENGGQISVKLGRKIYDDPNNPYGVDLIVYGNSFFSPSEISGTVSDKTDLDTATLGSSPYGHTTIVSVSQDGTNWYAYPSTSALFPENAYRWDDMNASWTDEQMSPTKPLNPFIYTNNFAGQSVADGLDQFIGASGGTGYDLKASGFRWIQYVRVQAGTSDHSVIDAIAAVDPVVVGDALSIAPDNVASGLTNLFFQNPADSSQNLIAIDFDSVSEIARVSTVRLSEFSAFAPVIGKVSSAYQITLKPVTGTNAVKYVADVGLRAGDSYTGDGGDLRVYEWSGTNWASQPFIFNSANNEALVAGVTNFSAFVVSQIVPPQFNIQNTTNGFAFQFTPVPNYTGTLERSTDFVTWTPISTFTATNAQPITLQDTHAPADKAFYRLLLNTR